MFIGLPRANNQSVTQNMCNFRWLWYTALQLHYSKIFAGVLHSKDKLQRAYR